MNDRIRRVMAAVFGRDDIDEMSSVDTIENWDSLRHINLIVALEEEFGVTFDEPDIPGMTNFAVIRSVLQAMESLQ